MSAATFTYDFTGPGTGPESGRSFWMSQNSLTRAFCLAPPPRAADLLDVFGTVYAADRRSKRCFKGVATGQRRICIHMPVREPEFWDFAGIGDPPPGTAVLGQRRRLES